MENSRSILVFIFRFLLCSIALSQNPESGKDTVWITVAYEAKGYVSGNFSHDKLAPAILIPYQDKQKRITTLNYADSIFILTVGDFPNLNTSPMYLPVKDCSLYFQALVGKPHMFQRYRKRIRPFEKNAVSYGYHHQPLIIEYVVVSMKVVLLRLGHAPLSILNIDKKKATDPYVVEYSPCYFLIEEILAVE